MVISELSAPHQLPSTKVAPAETEAETFRRGEEDNTTGSHKNNCFSWAVAAGCETVPQFLDGELPDNYESVGLFIDVLFPLVG